MAVSGKLDPVARDWVKRAWAQYSREQYGEGVREYEDFAVTARVRGQVGIAGVADGEIRHRVCRLAHLIVAPQWRSYGIGSQLLQAVGRVGVDHHCDRVRLEALAGGRAEGFYRERGYAVVATLPKWREERDFVMMERHLDHG